MKWLPEILIALALLVFGYLYLKPKASIQPFTRNDAQTERILNRITHPSRRDLAAEKYEQKSAAARHYNIINDVAYSCLDRYQRDRCVLNLIKCGPSCKTLIPREKFSRIESDYWAMVDEHQLRGKVRIPR